MREQDGPRVADPFVEVQPPLGGLSLEVGRDIAKLKRHDSSFLGSEIGKCGSVAANSKAVPAGLTVGQPLAVKDAGTVDQAHERSGRALERFR
jgi:hypothetical protein